MEPEHVRISIHDQMNAKFTWTLVTTHPAALADPALALDIIEGLCKCWSVGVYRTPDKPLMNRIVANISLRNKMRAQTLHNRFTETVFNNCEIYECPFASCDKAFFQPIGVLGTHRLTKVDGLWTSFNRNRLAMPQHIKDINMNNSWYPWQRQIINSLKIDSTGRKVNVLVDGPGCSGKSTVGIYAACAGLAQRVPQMSNHKELMQFVHSMDVSTAYFIDFPRQIGVHGAGQMWSVIEEIKNGTSFDARYHGRLRYFDPPTVWVFSNDFPDPRMLSKDRWRFWMIKDNKLQRVDMRGNEIDDDSQSFPENGPHLHHQIAPPAEVLEEEIDVAAFDTQSPNDQEARDIFKTAAQMIQEARAQEAEEEEEIPQPPPKRTRRMKAMKKK